MQHEDDIVLNLIFYFYCIRLKTIKRLAPKLSFIYHTLDYPQPKRGNNLRGEYLKENTPTHKGNILIIEVVQIIIFKTYSLNYFSELTQSSNNHCRFIYK